MSHTAFVIRRLAGWGAALALAVALPRLSAAAADSSVLASGVGPAGLPSWAPLVKRVLPAVVNVTAEIPARSGNDAGADAGDSGLDEEPGAGPPEPTFYDFLRRYFEQHGERPGTPLMPGTRTAMDGKVMSVGSAFVIDPAGYLVTNNHVVAHASRITVVFPDNSQHLATLVGADAKTDIALLKVTVRHKLPALQWGDSSQVEVGDWVMTVGNPFGLGGTVTVGVVSALGRSLQQGPFDDFLQIDAPINRGSSGGPTFDSAGRVVGINAAIYSPSGGSVGIGFAIPANIARATVRQLRENGHAEHGYLGFSIQSIAPEIARALHLDPEQPVGLLVNDVVPSGPAAKAGLLAGDIITRAEGNPVQMPHDVSKFVVTARIGDRLRLTVLRGDKTLPLELVIAAPPSPQALAAAAGDRDVSAAADTVAGLWFASLTADLRRELHLAAGVEGAVIGGIQPNSAAAAIGLIAGDVVMSIDRQTVTTPTEATRKLRGAVFSGDALILVNRRGNNQFMLLPGPG